jgi:hypothetical protein
MKGSKPEQKKYSITSSPISTHDVDDPGDETQRNFRYQHAYGVILLAAAASKKRPYLAIWCEHHEDLLCEREDGLFDGVQIKTRRPEIGDWKLTDDALRKSIKRFVSLIQRFDQYINELVFVSNTDFQDTELGIKDQAKLGRSPVRFLEIIRDISTHDEITSPFDESFNDLKLYCGCTEEELLKTLKKVHLVKGPTRESFEAEISHNHLPHLESCGELSRSALNAIRDELIYRFYSASSLAVEDPSKHWSYIDATANQDPVVQAKKIDPSILEECIQNHCTIPFRYAPGLSKLKLANNSGFNILEKKLERGGLASQVLTMKRRTLTSEQRLLELSHSNPEKFHSVLNQLECVVQAECDEALLAVSARSSSFGQDMLIDVQRRLKKIAEEEPNKVEFERYEFLIGIAGLLTEQCTVWWSETFDLGAVA